MALSARQSEMFEKPARAKPLKRAHMSDVGEGQGYFPYGANFKCHRCEWESIWYCFDNKAEIRRGISCPNCNK